MTKQSGEWLLTFDNGDVISSRLVIGADGAKSQVRTLAGIGSRGWQYRQSCMLITVDTGREQQDITGSSFSRPARVRFCRCLILMPRWSGMIHRRGSASSVNCRCRNCRRKSAHHS